MKLADDPGGGGGGGEPDPRHDAEDAADAARGHQGACACSWRRPPPIAPELYLSITLDRARGAHVVMASRSGGMDIEEVAATHPEKIIREWADPALGLQAFQARTLAFGLGLAGDQFKAGVGLILSLFRAYLDRDARSPRSIRSSSRGDGRVAGARRQARLRRQRPLPPPRDPGPARRQRGDAARRRGLAARAQLHQARRQRRLHGQRRGPRHGDHGHRQARGRGARQLPRRGRRRLAGADRERLPHPVLRPERQGGVHQRVRRHPALRPAGGGADRRREEPRPHAAHRRADGRHERGARAGRCSPSPASTSPPPPTWARAPRRSCALAARAAA